jgi:hypothetical protein
VDRKTISQKLRASKGSRKDSHVDRERVSITMTTRKRMLRQSPILKYGPSNNIAKFKEAISKTAIKQYGNLGKLI